MDTSPAPQTIDIVGAFNAHSHLRDESEADQKLLPLVAPEQEKIFEGCLAMPNTKSPITTGEEALRYTERISTYAPNLFIVSTIYLTPHTTREVIREASKAGVQAAKLYIGGATTNSSHGVPIEKLDGMSNVFSEMAECGMRLCVHGEDPRVAYRSREREFLPAFEKMVNTHPNLVIIFEHISCAQAIDVCLKYDNVYMTVTPHHLWLTEDDVWGDPWSLCMPVAKTKEDREALIKLVSSGHPRVIAGLDDAPHMISAKRTMKAGVKKAPFGIWNVRAALPIYAEILSRNNALPHLQALVSDNARKIYRLPAPHRRIQLVQEACVIPTEENPEAAQHFLFGETLPWSIRT